MRPAFVNHDLFKKGLKIRKEVLGPERVEHRLQTATEYTWPFEELATKSAWGLVWSRPGLPRKYRSLLILGALVAQNLQHELELHINAALRNGLTRKEIVESLLQMAIYCGYPKALNALRVMCQVFENLDAKKAASKKSAASRRKGS